MAIRVKTEYGVVSYGNPLFYKTIDDALAPFKGEVFLANYRGAFMDALVEAKQFTWLAERHVSASSKGVFIKIFVMIKFGVSISKTTSAILNSIASELTSIYELPIDDIEIVVTGVISKKVAKRDIHIRYRDLLANKNVLW